MQNCSLTSECALHKIYHRSENTSCIELEVNKNFVCTAGRRKLNYFKPQHQFTAVFGQELGNCASELPCALSSSTVTTTLHDAARLKTVAESSGRALGAAIRIP